MNTADLLCTKNLGLFVTTPYHKTYIPTPITEHRPFLIRELELVGTSHAGAVQIGNFTHTTDVLGRIVQGPLRFLSFSLSSNILVPFLGRRSQSLILPLNNSAFTVDCYVARKS